jgi:sec-independent protein translocase protein TatC
MSWLNKLLQSVFNVREKADGDVVKPFLDHMEDLRWTLLKMLLSLIVAMIVSFCFVGDLMELLRKPLRDVSPDLVNQLVTNGITEGLMITIELAFFAGIVLSLPFILYFLAAFIVPALTQKEKKFLFPGILASTCLFLTGSYISYTYVLPHTLKFFYDYSTKYELRIMWTWKDYFSFSSWLTIGLGLLCQLPVGVISLSLLGMINYRLLAATRSYAITAILILAAIVAPTPDPMTFITLATPIVLLYEMCIWIVWLIDRRRSRSVELREL